MLQIFYHINIIQHKFFLNKDILSYIFFIIKKFLLTLFVWKPLVKLILIINTASVKEDLVKSGEFKGKRQNI